jgi:hypothetical protein
MAKKPMNGGLHHEWADLGLPFQSGYEWRLFSVFMNDEC